MQALTADQLSRQLSDVTSQSGARAVVHRATQVAGVRRDRPMEAYDLLRVCQALAAEGGMVQQIAEMIATQTLADAAAALPPQQAAA